MILLHNIPEEENKNSLTNNCSNWCYRNVLVTLILLIRLFHLIASLPIVRHDINRKSFFIIFKKNRIIKEIADYYCSKKIVNKGSFKLGNQISFEN